jgi:2-phospho-L-lactate guanylyltransferase (CobY/MobA/RfbA family)
LPELIQDTALLIFSRTAAAEAAVKLFTPARRSKLNLKIASLLIERAKCISKKSGLPYFVYTEKEQRGDSFGERISNAVVDVFDKGFQKVIIIGNDCLQLTTPSISNAAQRLLTSDQVLIPTPRGGVSLIGINQSVFNHDSFCSVSWNTTRVFSDLQLVAKQSGSSTYIFPCLNDINNGEDLEKEILTALPFDYFCLVIKSILASFNVSKSFRSASLATQQPIFNRVLRGPPSH